MTRSVTADTTWFQVNRAPFKGHAQSFAAAPPEPHQPFRDGIKLKPESW